LAYASTFRVRNFQTNQKQLVRLQALGPSSSGSSPEYRTGRSRDIHIGRRIVKTQDIGATAARLSIPHCCSIDINDEIAVKLLECEKAVVVRTVPAALYRECCYYLVKYVEENTSNVWCPYCIAIPNGISGSHGAFGVYDKVTVNLEVKIHAIIEAHEGWSAGRYAPGLGVFPFITRSTEHQGSVAEEKERFDKHG